MIHLITRGDDAGSFRAANRALLEACRAGVLRNVSVMVPGPQFAEAARLFAEEGICLGLHITLNAEWRTFKWRPVLPPGEVPSLVDRRGRFLPRPEDLAARGFSVDEAVREIEAQLGAARRAGLDIRYLDEHMGVVQQAGLQEAVAALAEREGLFEVRHYPSLPTLPGAPPTTIKERLAARLERAAEGIFTWVTHPSYDAAELRALRGVGYPYGGVAEERDGERQLLCDLTLPKLLQEHRTEAVRYDEVVNLVQGLNL